MRGTIKLPPLILTLTLRMEGRPNHVWPKLNDGGGSGGVIKLVDGVNWPARAMFASSLMGANLAVQLSFSLYMTKQSRVYIIAWVMLLLLVLVMVVDFCRWKWDYFVVGAIWQRGAQCISKERQQSRRRRRRAHCLLARKRTRIEFCI